MRVLLCTIGTERSRATLAFGAEVAAALRASTVLLGVVRTPREEKRARQAIAEVERWMADQGLPVEVDIRWDEAAVRGDEAEGTLVRELESGQYDLVALGALGKQRSWRAFFASVAVRVLERARCSVLLIQGEPRALGRVLICTAGHAHSRAAVRMGSRLACATGAKATLLHVTEAVPSMYTGLDRMDEDLADLLQANSNEGRGIRLAAELLEAECRPAEIKLRQGVVTDEILEEQRKGGHDLIVIGSSRVSRGLMRYLLGDVTCQIVNHAECPVLVVHPDPQAANGPVRSMLRDVTSGRGGGG
jgi:nucleotide-binding universal stress UspA family protein